MTRQDRAACGPQPNRGGWFVLPKACRECHALLPPDNEPMGSGDDEFWVCNDCQDATMRLVEERAVNDWITGFVDGCTPKGLRSAVARLAALAGARMVCECGKDVDRDGNCGNTPGARP